MSNQFFSVEDRLKPNNIAFFARQLGLTARQYEAQP